MKFFSLFATYSAHSARLVCLFVCAFSAPTSASPRLSVSIIPKLTGFGSKTYAGSGRNLTPPRSHIYLVENLKDSGAGSLRACAEARGPRTCISLVGGVVQLSRAIKITHPFLTIAGQTAPFPGLTLTNAGITIETHDVLIQHLAIRPGDAREGERPSERDGISIGAPPPQAAYNIVIDHVSLTWAIDENISTAYPLTHDVTIAHSIIAEGLHDSIHPKGPHSKGIMVGDGSKNITIKRNFVAFNEERNPYLKPGTSVEFINNVVYGWGSKGGWSLCNLTNNTDTDAPVFLSFIGNVYRPGPDSIHLPPLYAKRFDPRTRVYSNDNIGPTMPARAVLSSKPASLIAQTLIPHPPVISPLTHALPAEVSLHIVPTSSGARPAERDGIDARILHDFERHEGTLKDCTSGCQRAAGTLNDVARTYRPLSLPRRPFGDTNKDGYTNLENWLHRFATPLERTRPIVR